jgi:hypothetical protein
MLKTLFPIIALALAVFVRLLVLRASVPGDDGATVLPLLMLLMLCEFGAIVALSGGYICGNQLVRTGFSIKPAFITLGCMILAVDLLLQGMSLWPQ